ncbi:MAG: twin-arginine translocation signal domain-containing protein [Verrucomicrobia bacterium]|nr:twin-arginine translocation signal domain-containing protein [Verrucomicrobiota bacterium]
MVSSAEAELDSRGRREVGRRSFLKGLGMAGATLLPASALLATKVRANPGDVSGSLTRGDAAILRFLAAAEIIESDLWEQYWELGGNQEPDFASTNPATGVAPNPTGGNTPYTNGLLILDGDMPQYIQDNTDDEFSHANFLIDYLVSKGTSVAELVRLTGTEFRTLPGSKATGSTKKGRLTNLTQLTVDTSYWGRYRTDNKNPDLDPGFKFDQAVPSLNTGKHTAIPRTNDDSMNTKLINAIAFTAGFHFGFIEQGGTSLYPSLAQRVSDPEVLRILLSIGPTETMHFQTWQDKAGNANTNPNGPPGFPPFTVHDPVNNSDVTFFDLHFLQPPSETLQANLIMPEPCPFLDRSKFPICSIIRPTETKGAAMGAVKALTADGLFIGQTDVFMDLIQDLAADADAAQRNGN